MYECHTVLLTPSQGVDTWKLFGSKFSRWTITRAKCEYSKVQPRVMYNDTWGIYENKND